MAWVSLLRIGVSACCAGLVVGSIGQAAAEKKIPAGPNGFQAEVVPFFEKHCTGCHGPEKSKGNITLHRIAGDLAGGHESEQWNLILEMLESGEMPPEDEPQPDEDEREAVVQWIDAGLRDHLARAAKVATRPAMRRLTNIEYENTMNDLLGLELKLVDQLPKDPVKPYKFNNTAEFMQLGPEQIDRYLESARRAMASAIVAPEKPEVQKTRREWQPHGVDRGLAGDEVGVWGNRRHTPAWGMGISNFPRTGEFRIRVKASAILPPGVAELPLRLVMGYSLNVNSSTQRIQPVGTVRLRNSPDHPGVYELRGRIENFPVQIGRPKRGKPQPDLLTITPQNLYDDGTLNDNNEFSRPRNLSMPRAVVEWMEFEAPLTDTWPPDHHARILFESPQRESAPAAYIKQVLTRFMSRAYRRPATAGEVDRFVKVYNLVAKDLGSLEAAMRETLAMVLISPQFLLHTVADGEAVSQQYELASKLSYFLWGSMPDRELMRLAAEGRLDDPATIGAQVHRLLADGRSRNFIDNFTTQWLSLAKMKTVPINRELFPRFLYYVPRGERAGTEEPYRPTIRDFMIEETTGFIAELVRRNASVLKIVDSDFAMLNQSLAAHYGVAGVEGDEIRPVALEPEHQLGGLLTHGSVLIGNGTGTAPHPIYRAVWLREAILGDEVKPPPADVPALTDSAGESAEKAPTIRDLLAQHRQKTSCNDCHARLDPWGIPFEQYNAIGKFQPMVPKQGTRVAALRRETHRDLAGYLDYLKTINVVEVQADARVPNGPEVAGVAGLKTYLLRERRTDIAENVLRRLLSYGIGRELDYRDRYAIGELLGRAEENGYRLQDMIVDICQNELFRGANQN